MTALPRFREAKTAQAAAFLLLLRGGRMHYIKLLKLLYLADREALRRWGVPITMDRYVSMRNGPVPSKTCDLIVGEVEKATWSRLISAPLGDHEVDLLDSAPPADLLSRSEVDLLKSIFEQNGHKNRWKLIDELHQLPEWRDPGDSILPISLADILAACGEDEAGIRAITADLEAEAAAERVLHPRG